MSVRVHIPSVLRNLYHTERIEVVEAENVAKMARALDVSFPGIEERILEPDGQLRRYVNVFVDVGEGRLQATAGSPLSGEAEVWIVQNIAGGCPGVAFVLYPPA